MAVVIELIDISNLDDNVAHSGEEVTITVSAINDGNLYDPSDISLIFYRRGAGGNLSSRLSYSNGEISRISKGIYSYTIPSSMTNNLIKGKYIVQWTIDTN